MHTFTDQLTGPDGVIKETPVFSMVLFNVQSSQFKSPNNQINTLLEVCLVTVRK